MTSARYRQIWDSIKTREELAAFVDAEIDEMIAAQIRIMRENRRWTQRELGEFAGMAQARISDLEDPNYGRYTLRTLKRLAEAFNVGLSVRFVPASRLVYWGSDTSYEDLAVPSLEEEKLQTSDDELMSVDGTSWWHDPVVVDTGSVLLPTMPENVRFIEPFLQQASTSEDAPLPAVAITSAVGA